MEAPSDGKKVVTLLSCDGDKFEVAEEAIMLSETIKIMIQDEYDGSAIPLTSVKGDILDMVLEYCEKHTIDPPPPVTAEGPKVQPADVVDAVTVLLDNGITVPTDTQGLYTALDQLAALNDPDVAAKKAAEAGLKAWEVDFLKDVSNYTLGELIMAANYLNIKGLINLSCMAVAKRMKPMSPEKIRECFNMPDDLTREDKAKIVREFMWAFKRPK